MTLDEYHAERGMSVPMLITKCIYAVEQMGGLQKEGIYRMSGRQSNVEALRYAFEQNEQGVELDKSKFDVITIAAVLKVFLRELKTPLFHLTVQTRMEYASKFCIVATDRRAHVLSSPRKAAAVGGVTDEIGIAQQSASRHAAGADPAFSKVSVYIHV